MNQDHQPQDSAQTGKVHSAQSGGRSAAGSSNGKAADSQQGRAAEEAVVEQTAEASREAVRANSQILRSNIETAQQAMQTSVEATARSFEVMGQSVTRMWGIADGGGSEEVKQSAENVKVASRAASTLAKSAQDASREWMNLAQQSVKTNMEAMSELASCRSLQDLVSLQSKFMRQNLEQIVQANQTVAETSRRTLDDAARAFHS